jgi:hypothetical protein
VAFIVRWTEVVAQRTGNGGGVEGGRGSLGKEACERHAYNKETREGDPVRKRGQKSRADKCAGERGAYSARARQVRRHAAAMRVRLTWAPPPAASAGHTVTATRQV